MTIEGTFQVDGDRGILGIAPAITNAISNAAGVRLGSLPMCPEKVFRAMQGKD